MPVIINGSTGISGTDGSAGTPAVQGTDGNTGMFFPAADQIAFAEGGVEAMRLDANGNVGIGTSSLSLGVVGLTVYRPGGASIALQNATTGTSAVSGFQVIGGGGGDAYIWNYSNSFIAIGTNGVERGRFTSTGDFQFNSGYGSVATAYACRAWVKFNGTGTVAINGSANVSSIADNGIGLYTVNFTNTMPDTNYSVVATNSILSGFNGSTTDVSAGNGGRVYTCFMCVSQATPPTTTAVRVSQGNSYYSGDSFDPNQVHVAIFR